MGYKPDIHILGEKTLFIVFMSLENVYDGVDQIVSTVVV